MAEKPEKKEEEKPTSISQQIDDLKNLVSEMQLAITSTINKRFDELKKILTSEEW